MRKCSICRNHKNSQDGTTWWPLQAVCSVLFFVEIGLLGAGS